MQQVPDGVRRLPQLGSADARISRRVWKKMESLAGANTRSSRLATGWAMRRCSPIAGKDRLHPQRPLDLFRPHSRKEIRQELNLSLEEPVILFGADSLANPRKGFAYLRAAARSYRQRYNRDVTLVCFGEVPAGFDPQMDCRLFLTGFLRDETLLAKLFSMADVYVIPSLEENLPNTAVEALSCGLPVVGFRGRNAEIVSQEVTGHLGEAPSDSRGLKAWCLEPGRRGSMRCLPSRAVANRPGKQTNAYISFFGRSLPCRNCRDRGHCKQHGVSPFAHRKLLDRSEGRWSVDMVSPDRPR
jgi:glycosyltransferase involved in cell wall biosynthesis